MSVILLILKIIGWILLTLFLLLLVAVFLVLFVPVRYRAEGSVEESVRIQGKVHWMLYLLSIDFSYGEDGFSYESKIFGKHISSEKKQEDEEEPEDESDKDGTEKIAAIDEKTVAKDDMEISEQESGTDRQTLKHAAPEKSSFRQKITEKFHDFCDAVRGIREKISDLFRQAEKIKAVLTDEQNHKAFSVIWKELMYLLKHSRFRKIDAELNFALWEPSATGQALGVIAMFPAFYQYDIGIYPDFEADKTYVKGTFLVKGHIRLVHVLISGIRLVKERDIRNLIKMIFK